ncbi:multiple sugar transport system ATP-binding protein [Amaricoccus macauensis]|uniref:Multiple sugar transport system ATP-binding protein n=1 Tax=Amaricoccus macauensis TaxID=57001 RepID=A0A840SKC1_9RHOB|nr:ABC transporter ATP-binding protein [Amaricoccus macauensis]MBB5220608.1 multiple sugar transport system ATP-binding protein [Amaricoccus macauensis]
MNQMTNPAATSVAVKDLRLAYGSLTILDDLSLDIGEGEFIVLLGPSGCGKSTLLNCIAGLLDITDGQIWIKGRNVTWEEPKDRGIGMVFQSYALYPQMTVRGNLAFGLKNAGLPRGEIDKRIARAAEILQIQPLLDRKPAALSGGQRQRVAIGRALVRDVDVFLFDEPLSNLDAKLRSELRVEIKRLHQQLRNTMIYVTHDQIEALTLADRIAVMRGGIIQQLADPKTIYNKPANLFVAGFIGSPAMTFLKGQIGERDGVRTFEAGGSTIALDQYRGEVPARGTAVILGVRPEHVAAGHVAAGHGAAGHGAAGHGAAGHGATGAGGAAAKVEIDEPMGSDSLLWLRFAGQALSARAPAEHGFKAGDAVSLGFDISKASLFDTETEQRL